MGTRGKKPGLKEIAQHVGVSVAAVSAVINNRTKSTIRLAPETRQRILDAIAEFGYSPNAAAQVLVGGRSRIIAVFTYEPVFPFEYHSFYYPFLLGMERQAEVFGYDLLLMTSSMNQEGRRSIYNRGVNRVRLADAAILLGLEKNSEEIGRLLDEGFPVVIVGHRDIPGHEASYVAADYESATAAIVERLAALGHSRLALLQKTEDVEPVRDRRLGFVTGCRKAGIPEDQTLSVPVNGNHTGMGLLALLQKHRISAVVCERYEYAEMLKTAMERSDLLMPGDLSVAHLGGPRGRDEDLEPLVQDGRSAMWTRLSVPQYDMGAEAIRLAMDLIKGTKDPPVRSTIPCGLIDGTTVGPPRTGTPVES